MGILTGGPDPHTRREFRLVHWLADRTKMIAFWFIAVSFVLGIVITLTPSKPKAPVCHGQCGHDYKCYEMCAKAKDGCPHWSD
jgi:hypothetical protein